MRTIPSLLALPVLLAGCFELTPTTGATTASGAPVVDTYTGDLSGGTADFCAGFSARRIEGNLTLTGATGATQADVDGLTCLVEVTGGLTIEDIADLEDLDGLAGLTSVGGDLVIRGETSLIDVDGLAGLTSVGADVVVSYTEILEDLDGLGNLTSIGGELYLQQNYSLLSIEGLGRVSSFTGFLAIAGNPSLCEDSVQAFMAQLDAIGWQADSNVIENGDFCGQD